MKKVFSFVAIAAMSLAVVSCGETEAEAETTAAEANEEVVEEAEAETTAAEATEEVAEEAEEEVEEEVAE